MNGSGDAGSNLEPGTLLVPACEIDPDRATMDTETGDFGTEQDEAGLEGSLIADVEKEESEEQSCDGHKNTPDNTTNTQNNPDVSSDETDSNKANLPQTKCVVESEKPKNSAWWLQDSQGETDVQKENHKDFDVEESVMPRHFTHQSFSQSEDEEEADTTHYAAPQTDSSGESDLCLHIEDTEDDDEGEKGQERGEKDKDLIINSASNLLEDDLCLSGGEEEESGGKEEKNNTTFTQNDINIQNNTHVSDNCYIETNSNNADTHSKTNTLVTDTLNQTNTQEFDTHTNTNIQVVAESEGPKNTTWQEETEREKPIHSAEEESKKQMSSSWSDEEVADDTHFAAQQTRELKRTKKPRQRGSSISGRNGDEVPPSPVQYGVAAKRRRLSAEKREFGRLAGSGIDKDIANFNYVPINIGGKQLHSWDEKKKSQKQTASFKERNQGGCKYMKPNPQYIRKRKPITDDAKSKILATCNKDDHNGQPSDIEDSEYDPDSEHSGSESKGEEVEQKDNDKESPFEEGKVETRRQSRRASRSCTISKKESASKAAHSKSKSTRVGGTKSQCPVCKAMFARKDYTRKHMNKIHPEEAQLPENRSLGGLRRDYCDFCSKPFGNLSDHKRKSCRLNPNSVWSKKQEEKRHKHIANKALSQPKFIAAPPATQQITSLDIPDDPFLVQQVQNNATKPPTQQDLEKRGCNKIINSFTTFLTTSKIVHLNTARIYVAKMRKFLEFSESQNPLFIADLLLEMNRPSGIELPLPHQYILTCCNSSAAMLNGDWRGARLR